MSELLNSGSTGGGGINFMRNQREKYEKRFASLSTEEKIKEYESFIDNFWSSISLYKSCQEALVKIIEWREQEILRKHT
jgi:hypothetical protein